MEEVFEEVEDIVDAHDTVLFGRGQGPEMQLGIDILTYLAMPPHVVDLTDQPDLERMVLASSRGVSLPVIFVNGQFFSGVFYLIDGVKAGQVGPALDRLGADYDKDALEALRALNQ